jgi:hypothetical protein
MRQFHVAEGVVTLLAWPVNPCRSVGMCCHLHQMWVERFILPQFVLSVPLTRNVSYFHTKTLGHKTRFNLLDARLDGPQNPPWPPAWRYSHWLPKWRTGTMNLACRESGRYTSRSEDNIKICVKYCWIVCWIHVNKIRPKRGLQWIR